jgi:hypothetical protein
VPFAQHCVELPDGLDDPEAGADGTLYVILVCAGITKIDQKPVAKVLGDVTVEAGDHLPASFVVGAHDLAPLFGVEPAGERRRPDEVAEEHGQLSPFAAVAGIPHQPLAVLADGVGVRIEQLGPQCVEAIVIKPEMFLERAIGYSITVAEEVDHLVEHRIEVHVSPRSEKR